MVYTLDLIKLTWIYCDFFEFEVLCLIDFGLRLRNIAVLLLLLAAVIAVAFLTYLFYLLAEVVAGFASQYAC